MTIELGTLQTELRNEKTINIDVVPTLEVVTRMHEEDIVAAKSVAPALETIAALIDGAVPKVRKGGRVIYMGAGSSGRLGILDASEIPATFSAPPTQFIGIMAGGDVAIRTPVEGAEDSVEAGENALKELDLDAHLDTVIGLAASGRTPYVLGGLGYAKSVGCLTAAVTAVSPSEFERSRVVDHVIATVTGPEVVTGSTRLKAGTAMKLVLNMISTGIMIRIGKTSGNLMVDVNVSNFKLRGRSRRILRTICGEKFYVVEADGNVSSLPVSVPETADGDLAIDRTIDAARRSVKLAIVVAKTGLSIEKAAVELAANDGVLAKVLESVHA